MELTRDEARALAKRSLRRAAREIDNNEMTAAVDLAQRAAAFAGMAKELGTFANGCETRIARIELADRPNPYVEAATAAGWTQVERKWTHPDHPSSNAYYSAAALCDDYGLEVTEAA